MRIQNHEQYEEDELIEQKENRQKCEKKEKENE